MARTIVGVLRGGSSPEYNLSLKSGAAALNGLSPENFETRDIFIDKRGYWHLRGMPADPARSLSQVDVVLNALHGGAGEDGTVQRILERLGLPYTGPRPTAAASSLNKIRARDILRGAGIRVPLGAWFSLQDNFTTAEMAKAVFSIFGPPYVVKPAQDGAGRGIRIAQTLAQLPDAIGDVLDEYGLVLIEEFIRGQEATVGVVEKFRGEDLYALPPAHVQLPSDARIIEPAHHEDSLLRYSVPSAFSRPEKQALVDAAKAAHAALGLSHFSRADMILTPRSVYVLEVNAIPGIYEGAALPAMLDSVGSSVTELLEHSIALARV